MSRTARGRSRRAHESSGTKPDPSGVRPEYSAKAESATTWAVEGRDRRLWLWPDQRDESREHRARTGQRLASALANPAAESHRQ